MSKIIVLAGVSRRCLPDVKTVKAIKHICKMRGGSQSHLIQCSDGNYYVVKFRNNPQHCRVLINEFLGTRLATALKLPVFPMAFVEVDRSLMEQFPGLKIELQRGSIPCEPGIHFGSRYPIQSKVFDYLSPNWLKNVWNADVLAGALAFDKWTGNTDVRQIVFLGCAAQRGYIAVLIDQGYCFGAGKWTLGGHIGQGLYPHLAAYKIIEGWASFEPWLTRIERMSANTIRLAASPIPPAWYEGEHEELEHLICSLIERKAKIRNLISDVKMLSRSPFPKWHDRSVA